MRRASRSFACERMERDVASPVRRCGLPVDVGAVEMLRFRSGRTSGMSFRAKPHALSMPKGGISDEPRRFCVMRHGGGALPSREPLPTGQNAIDDAGRL